MEDAGKDFDAPQERRRRRSRRSRGAQRSPGRRLWKRHGKRVVIWLLVALTFVGATTIIDRVARSDGASVDVMAP